MNKQSSIMIISPYFGHINDFFRLWLRSAINNPTINFLIISDDSATISNLAGKADNIHCIRMTLEGFQNKLSKVVGIDCCLPRARKVCDYRPALGLVFADCLNGFDLWGYCDNDLIFGDIRLFLTEQKLADFEKFYTWGHLTLVKNNEKCNHLFLEKNKVSEGLTFEAVSCNPYNCYFEERPFTKLADENGISQYKNEDDFADIDVFQFSFHDKKWTHNAKKPFYIEYEDGHVFACFSSKKSINTRREVLYAHFQKRKLNIHASCFLEENLCFLPNFVIPSNSFSEKQKKTLSSKRKVMYGFSKKIRYYRARLYNKIHREIIKDGKQIFF